MKEFIKNHLVAILCVIAVIILGAATIIAVSSSDATIKQTVTEMTVEAGKEVSIVVSECFNVDAETAEKAIVDVSKVDATKVGEYDVTVIFGKAEYIIKVKVVDTTAPVVDVEHYITYTNTTDIGIESFGSVYDISDCTVTIDRYVKVKDAFVVTDEDLTIMVNEMNANFDASTFADRADVKPSEDGVYSAILSATDISGNKSEKEVLVIYDTTAPSMTLNAEVNSITVEADDISVTPDMYLDKLIVVDNFDGALTVSADNATLTDKGTSDNTHTWEVTVKATDKAGNEGVYTYTILVNKKVEVVVPSEPSVPSTPSEPSVPSVPSTPSEPSNPGDSGNGNIVNVNGFTLDLSGKDEDGITFGKKLAEAGLYNPVWNESMGAYYMVIKRSDNVYSYDEWLREYIVERGGTPGSGGWNNWGECVSEDLVLLYITVN